MRLGLARQEDWGWDEKSEEWRLGLAMLGEWDLERDEKPGVWNRQDWDRDKLKGMGQTGSHFRGMHRRVCITRAHSPSKLEWSPRSLSGSHTGKVSHSPVVLVYTDDDNLLLLPVVLLAQMVEVCAVDQVPPLLMTHANVNMISCDRVSGFFSVSFLKT